MAFSYVARETEAPRARMMQLAFQVSCQIAHHTNAGFQLLGMKASA
jgi:quercetin dioxygenase-like cupin family protein